MTVMSEMTTTNVTEPSGRQPAPSRAAATHLPEHLSNERTYLAYLRTSVSLISFGITINRFSIYLMQSERLSPGASRRVLGVGVDAERVGIGMVILGMALLAWASVRYTQIAGEIERQEFRPKPRVIWVLTGTVLVLALSGLVWMFLR